MAKQKNVDDEPDVADVEDAKVSNESPEIEEHALTATEVPETSAELRRSGIGAVSLIFAALLAAGAFLAAQYISPARWPFPDQASEVETLTQTIAQQAAAIDDLKAQIANLRAATDELAPKSDISRLEVDIRDAAGAGETNLQRMGELRQRIVDLENRPIPDVGATAEAVATYERELAAMRQMLEGELERIETAQEQATDAGTQASDRATTAARQAIVARMQSALDTGAPLDGPLAELQATGFDGGSEVTTLAGGPVATLSSLISDFPDAARRALNAAIQADVEAGRTNRFTAFLRTQLGARSLEPREGTDPDAILSRAEAAIQAHDISASLAELVSLPEAARAEMATWIGAAERRQAALAALAALATQVNG